MNEYNEIDRLLSDLVHFVVKNPFDFSLYDSYAKSIATAFDREFTNTPETGRKMTMSRLKDDVNLSAYIIVRKPSMHEEGILKERHRQIMNLFRNHIKSDIENRNNTSGGEKSYKLADWVGNTEVAERVKDYLKKEKIIDLNNKVQRNKMRTLATYMRCLNSDLKIEAPINDLLEVCRVNFGYAGGESTLKGIDTRSVPREFKDLIVVPD